MASTTKTANLELSQFVGTDKPTWLTDYNGDMHKIDDGYKKLKDANTTTQADLDATKKDLSESNTDINNVKASVQALEAQDNALGNRLTVVEGNYDTIHHEVAIDTQSITDIKTDLGMDTPLTTTATTVHGAINELVSKESVIDFTVYLSPNGSDDNDGATSSRPMKTIVAALNKYYDKAQNLFISLAAGTYDIASRVRLRIPKLSFIGTGDTNSNVVININTDLLWADIITFSKVTVNVDVRTSLEGNRIDFASDAVLNLNEDISVSNTINMQGNSIKLNDHIIKVGSGSMINVYASCNVTAGTGFIDIAGGIGFVKTNTNVHVNSGGVLFHNAAITPVTTTPYVATAYN